MIARLWPLLKRCSSLGPTRGGSLLLFVLLLLGVRAAAQQEPIVKQIDIRGARRVDESTIRFKLKTQVGEPYSPGKVREDIRAIYALGFFDDVAVEADVFEGGLKLTYVLTEKPSIRHIRIEGSQALKEKKIREKIDLAEGAIIAPGALQQNAERIRLLYEEEGYVLAKVEPSIDRVSEREVDVLFRIQEGEKFNVRQIHIISTKGLKESQVKKVMETKPLFLFFFGGTLKREELQRDLDRIKAFYLDNGYLNIKVEEPQVEYDAPRRAIRITIRVDEGPQFKVSEVSVTGNTVFSREEILQDLALKPGGVFSRETLQKDILALTDRYSERGYLFVDVAPVTRVRAEERLVDISLELTEGRQAFVERINISGNLRTRDKVVRRDLLLVEGDVYNSRLLQKSRQNLVNTGFFDEVKVDTKRGSADDKVDIDVELKERPTGTFTIGGGFSSLDGPLFVVGLAQTNFFGLGQRASLNGQFGTRAARFNLQFSDPHVLDSDYSAAVNVFSERRNFRTFQGFNEDRRGGTLTVGHPLFEAVAGALTYRYEQVKIFDLESNAPFLIQRQIAQQGERTTTSSMALGLSRDTRDNPLDPSRGLRLNTFYEYAGGVLDADNDFTKTGFEFGYFHPIIGKVIGHVRGSIQYGDGYGRTKILPVQERFFLGGTNTIRGFRNFTVSPRDSQTEGLTGGNKAFFAQNEVIFPLYNPINLKGVVFFDAGNVFAENQPFEATFRTGAGVGVRFTTPIGPVRVEYGFNLSPKSGERRTELHFAVGTFF